MLRGQPALLICGCVAVAVAWLQEEKRAALPRYVYDEAKLREHLSKLNAGLAATVGQAAS